MQRWGLALGTLPMLLGVSMCHVAPREQTKSASATAQPVQAAWADVAPIFRAHCVSCHSGGAPAAGLNLASYAGVAKGGVSGRPFKPGDPAGSLLMKRIEGTIPPQMPLGGTPLSAAERKIVADWIRGGAVERSASDPRPTPEPAPPAGAALPKAGEPVFYRHVAPILGKRCASCHTANGRMGPPPERYRLDSYANAIRSGERANVIPGNPRASQLVRLVAGKESPRMPYREPPLSAEEIRVLTDWIAQGARSDDGKKAPMPVGREVRYEGVLDGRWSVDGIALDARGARLDKSPRVGGRVEVRGVVQADGTIRATRIRGR